MTLWKMLAYMNLFYSVKIGFMKSLSLPVLKPKSSLFYGVTHGHLKVRPKKQQVPFTLSKIGRMLFSRITVSSQIGWSNESWELGFFWPLFQKIFPKYVPKNSKFLRHYEKLEGCYLVALQSRLCQDDQMWLSLSLTIITVGLLLVIIKSTSQKTASPFDTMILEGCYLVALQSRLSQDDQMSLGNWAFTVIDHH